MKLATIYESENQRMFHGTSKKLIDSIKRSGIKMHDDQENGLCISLMDSLEKAKGVAAYFGKDGIVVEVDVPQHLLEYHPDYGYSPEYDTVRFRSDITPERIVNVYPAPNHNITNIRPAGMQLRTWKSGMSQKERRDLDQSLGIDPNAVY